MKPYYLIYGMARDYPTNTWIIADIVPAAYAEGDSLVGNCLKSADNSIVFSPAVSFYNGNWAGGQVLIEVSNANALLVTPGISYCYEVLWTPAAQPAKTSSIARIPLIVLPRAHR